MEAATSTAPITPIHNIHALRNIPNIDETKFVGAYITKEMSHVAEGDWEFVDGFGFGVNFGIDF